MLMRTLLKETLSSFSNKVLTTTTVVTKSCWAGGERFHMSMEPLKST